jgi:transposase
LGKDNLSKQEYIRVNAVLLKKKKYTLKQIEDITGKAEVTVQNWITAYNKYGIDGLRTKKREVAPCAKLTNKEKDEIKQAIIGHKPSEKGYAGDFWSVPALKRLVKDKYDVEYKSANAYRDLLHYCGFSYQKAEYVDRRKDNASQGHFRKRFEKKLKKGIISMWW